LVLASGAFAQDAQEQQKLFERVFGDAVRLDPAQAALVTKDKPGKRYYVDRNNDGAPEEVWFIDLDSRHPETMRPVLVRVIDEDGDLCMGCEPDLDSDLYVVDWKADGTVDALTDYMDNDRDNDVDEMGIYFIGWKKQKLTCWWGEDIGDDNLLWHDVGYTYQQHDCQFRTHFGGNEIFSAYTIGLEDKEWQPGWENPFAFYDKDCDGVTEEVLRIEGQGSVIKNLRYSFDADNDADIESPRDFDVSISAHAPTDTLFELHLGDKRTLRGIPAGAFLAYQEAPKYALTFPWATYMLTWDENDLNIDGEAFDGNAFKDPQERWEGVITKGNDYFKQIGGPSCGTVNKRFEVDVESTTPIQVYYSQTDQRIHLFGANHAWLLVDYNFDRTPDLRYDYRDTDGNGYLDTWSLDLNMDGKPDDEWKAGSEIIQEVPYTFAGLNEIMKPLLDTLPGELFQLDVRLQQALATAGISDKHPLAALLESGFDLPQLSVDLRLRLLNSNETWRYYLDLLKDSLFVALRAKHPNAEFWNGFDAVRAQGDVNGMRAAVEKEFNLSDALPDLASFRANIVAHYDHPCVAWAQDWVPPNIGWESEQAAYRAYWGQFDFFGKKCDQLIYPIMNAGESYHGELEWGIDALHVNDTCGLGGITLYVNGKPYPVYSPNGKGAIVWSKRLLEENKNAISIELTAEKAGPEAAPYTVRFKCTALAHRKDSPIQITIDGGNPSDALEVGLGIRKLPQELFAHDADAGLLANWGIQEPAIGWIGLGLVYPKSLALRTEDLPNEHQVIVKAEHGKPLTYHIQGTWLKGRRFDRCPTISNWMGDLKETATLAGLK
nr:DUF4861 family protein [Candidatus Hydrogenedentota bacterium]